MKQQPLSPGAAGETDEPTGLSHPMPDYMEDPHNKEEGFHDAAMAWHMQGKTNIYIRAFLGLSFSCISHMLTQLQR